MPDDAPYLLDVTRLIWRRWRGRQPTGIDRVALAYLRHFGPRAQAVVQHESFRRILDTQASQELFALLDEPTDRFKATLVLGALGNLRRLHGQGKGRLYLNVGHTGLDSAGFRTWVGDASVRPVYLVHDIIPVTHPEFCRAGEDARHKERMRTVVRTGAGVIANSRATLHDLSHFAALERLDMPASMAAWLGTEPLPATTGSQLPERSTFVTIGTIEARKNHMLLLKIWSRLINKMGSDAPQLLIIGQRGWEAEPVFRLLDADEKLRGHVVELGRCSDEDIARHLASARALLFPSLAEGYGLPLMEALGMGVPAVVSDLPVFREICGAMPDYLNARDERAWEAAILDYSSPASAARAAQLKRIEGYRPPDWTTHFNQVEAWLTGLS
jgi:glycosyltransferase involved in cell wall biosynthesis